MWKVLIADDEPKIRQGLKKLLSRCCDDLEVVGRRQDHPQPCAHQGLVVHDEHPGHGSILSFVRPVATAGRLGQGNQACTRQPP